MTRLGELLQQNGRYLAIASHYYRYTELLSQLSRIYGPCESRYHCIPGAAGNLLKLNDARYHGFFIAILDMAEDMIDQAPTKFMKSRLHLLRGELLAATGKPESARISCQRAFEIYPHPEFRKLIGESLAANCSGGSVPASVAMPHSQNR